MLETLGNVEKYWEMLENIRKYWEIETQRYYRETRRKNTDKCLEMLEKIKKCWEILGKYLEATRGVRSDPLHRGVSGRAQRARER